MKHKKQQTWQFWLVVGLIAQLLIAPNPTILKAQTDLADPLLLNAVRGAFSAIVALPFIFLSLRRWTSRGLIYAIGAGLCMSVATNAMIFALKYSEASYVVVLSFISPIILVFLSNRLLHEKITPRGMAGMTLAGLGAFVVVALPLIFSGSQVSFHVYPLATALMLINAIFFPIGVILLRIAHQTGANLMASQGVSTLIVCLISCAMLYATGGSIAPLSGLHPTSWIALVYSGVVVIFLARVLTTLSYEHIGAVATSGLTYLESLVAIVIPVLVLGERLSATIAVGGALILFGVYLTEQHHAKHRLHFGHLIHH